MRLFGLLALALVLVFCRTICAQEVGDILGHCHCNYSSSTNSGRQTIGCNSSRICPIIYSSFTPGSFTGARTRMACILDYRPLFSGKEEDLVYQKCVSSDFEYNVACSPPSSAALPDIEGIVVKVNVNDPFVFTVCCWADFCNTEDLFRRVQLLLAPPTTAELEEETTTTDGPPTTSTPHQTTPPTITTVPTNPPLYAVVAIPVLSVTVIVVLVIIVLLLCLHFHVWPSRRQRSSRSSDVPTITSQDSSSCGEQSLNDQDYSGSGAGKPVLTQLSIAGQISLHELIGKGRYGEVWKGLYKCDEVAVKIFKTMDQASWAHEVNIYKTCLFRHPNILRFIASDSRDVSYQIELWLITEFCEFGSLYDLLVQRSIEPATMLQLAYTASCGLDHLHTEILGQEAKHAIVHRDLKSRNILVKADFTCCIGDLGLALRYYKASDQVEDPPSKRVGTKRYLAPEIIDESISFKHFDAFKRADMYSFGLVLWEIATRGEVEGVAEDYQMPYQNLVPTDPSFEDMRKTVVVDKRRPTLPNRWTQEELFRGVSKLIQQCWLHESDARLTSLRLKKSLYNLQKSCILEKKKDKEQSS